MKKSKKCLAVLLAVLITVVPLPFTALAGGAAPMVSGIEFEAVSIIEGTNGEVAYEYYDEDGTGYNEYYRYSYSPQFTLTLDDGTVLSSEYGGVSYNGEWYSLSWFDDQGYNREWGVGIHTVPASILGFDTSFTVEIVENPVEMIEFEDITIIEGTNGNFTRDYDGITDTYSPEYFYYGYMPVLNVTLKNGDVLESQHNGFSYNDEWYSLAYSDGQSYQNQWGVGAHTIQASILGFSCSFTVNIIPCPVESISFAPVSFIEGTHGTMSYEDDENNQRHEYYRYFYNPMVTVTMTNGDVLYSDEIGNIYYNDEYYSLSYTDDQSYTNPWGIGTHTVTTELLGYKTSFPVEIIESPVAQLVVNDTSIFVGGNIEMDYGHDPETNEYQPYYRYIYRPDFTVVLKNGDVLESEGGGVTYQNEWYSLTCSDDQSYSNIWNVGEHTATASILGAETSFTVVLEESPVAEISIEDVTVLKGENVHVSYDYNEETGMWDLAYNRYYYPMPSLTITLKNGMVLKSDWGYVDYNGQSYRLDCTDDQSYMNQWDVGEHTVKATIMGVDTTFKVLVTETPIAKIEFQKMSFIEGTNGYTRTDYNPDTGNYEEYYYYNYRPEYTVTLNNGDTLTSEWGCIYYNGRSYHLEYEDGQSFENQWKIGQHTVTASLLGFETSFTVEITESPYVLMEILEVYPLTENQNCYINESGDTIYFNNPTVIFRITDKDGKSILVSSVNDQNVEIWDNQYEEPWTVGGENWITVNYMNLSAEGSVELEPASPFEYFEQDGGLYITGYRLYGQEQLDIPSEIDGIPVVGILSLEDAEAKRITIPDSVTTIGENAFHQVYGLESIAIGSGVNYLDVNMFAFCDVLTSITVSKNNPNYCDEDGVLYNKQKTVLVAYPLAKGEDYTVPASVTDIDVLNCDIYGFLNVTIAEGSKMFVTEDGVTYNANKTKVIFCDKNKSGNYIMPNTVTEIAENAFSGCTELTGVTVSDKVTSIVYSAFYDCASLTQITLPSQLVSIGDWAFQGCSELSELSVPSSLKSVGSFAFFSCEGLSKVNITDLTSWCNIDFSGLESNPIYYADTVCINGVQVTEMQIPNGVTRINDYAFAGYSGLETVTIPGSVKEIGVSAFTGVNDLKAITIPNSVTEIGFEVFSGCASLQSVSIGAGLTEIPDFAFCGSGLEQVTVPKNITRIGSSAFSYCFNLKEVVFTNSNVEIGSGAFAGCPLEELNLPDGIKNAGGQAAFANTNLTKLTLPNSVTGIAYGNFAGCEALAEIDIPESVVSMGGHAFDRTAWYGAQPDGEVYLEHVFYGYKGTMPANTEISLKDGTTVIADFALEDQKNLTKLTLPEGMKTVGFWAFYDCSGLSEINIPASVTDIDTSAFAGCSSLTAINVSPDNQNYKSIDGVLFNKDGTELLWCPKRDNARYEVPKSVTKIATGAFSDSGVVSVKIMNPDTELCEYSVGYCSIGIYDWYESFYSESFGWSGGYFDYSVVEIVCPKDSNAYVYAKENLLLATVPEAVKIETDNQDVVISATTDVISEDTVISVEQKETGSIAIVEDTTTEKYDLDTAVVFDISLKKDEVKIQPNGELTISIALPENLVGEKCRVLYIDDEGNVTDMRAVCRNGFMVFTTDHFSHYALVETHIMYGDANNSQNITLDDVVVLAQYVAEWDIECNEAALDVNGDGVVNLDDIVHLAQYVAEWEGIVLG